MKEVNEVTGELENGISLLILYDLSGDALMKAVTVCDDQYL